MPRHATKTSFKYDPDAHITLVCESCYEKFNVRRCEFKKRIRRGSSIRYCSMKCMGKGRLAENNHNWVGDNISKAGVHSWIRRILRKPELCELCGAGQAIDLANITGIYNRDLSNWRYMCRSCHSIYDGDINNIPR